MTRIINVAKSLCSRHRGANFIYKCKLMEVFVSIEMPNMVKSSKCIEQVRNWVLERYKFINDYEGLFILQNDVSVLFQSNSINARKYLFWEILGDEFPRYA